ncbi:MAG: hypothetical protein GY757_30275 [bacterium]|nr:hypothetical protein [bacterium]
MIKKVLVLCIIALLISLVGCKSNAERDANVIISSYEADATRADAADGVNGECVVLSKPMGGSDGGFFYYFQIGLSETNEQSATVTAISFAFYDADNAQVSSYDPNVSDFFSNPNIDAMGTLLSNIVTVFASSDIDYASSIDVTIGYRDANGSNWQVTSTATVYLDDADIVLKYDTIDTEYSYLGLPFAYGMVVNDGNQPAYDISIALRFYDADGALWNTVIAYPASDTYLRGNEQAGFSNYATLDYRSWDSVATYTWQSQWTTGTGVVLTRTGKAKLRK